PRQLRENVVGRMRDQSREVIGADNAALGQEVEQVRHLFEIRRHIRIIAPQVNVVEYDIDDPFDLAARRMQLTCRRSRLRNGTGKEKPKRQRYWRAQRNS